MSLDNKIRTAEIAVTMIAARVSLVMASQSENVSSGPRTSKAAATSPGSLFTPAETLGVAYVKGEIRTRTT
jgi:hypothetical protein